MNPSRDQKSLPVRMTLGGKPSGLRNPSRALRGLGSIALFLEAVVLLLAIQPIRVTQGSIGTAQLVMLLASACVAILLTGLLRSTLGWWLSAALQAALIAGGVLLHWMIGAVGVLFGLVWLYVFYVRHKVLR
jgi:hypothetical protein